MKQVGFLKKFWGVELKKVGVDPYALRHLGGQVVSGRSWIRGASGNKDLCSNGNLP